MLDRPLLRAVPLTAALMAAVSWSVRVRAVETDPYALASALQRKYDSVRDFSADFVHSYEGGVLRKKVTESGHVLVKKPGRMRWTYTEPEEKVFVSDGVRMYSYIPSDRQVYVARIPPENQATTPALFLTGKGNLLRDFEIKAAEVPREAGPDAAALELVPRIAERDYDKLILVVDRDSLELRMLISEDRQGGRSTFTFTRLRENIGLKDRQFEFKIPRGVEVVTASSQ
ncbi:MAG TPA: outer membrane lipoprotein chaperone LolA [Vicinamibacterales bacterium]|nr:outer membrane lipoprotein chaperone LolA [Vicinamibacterales bacterium]